MKKVGPANLRAGTKKGSAPHPKKTDDKFGSKTDYAKPATVKIGLVGHGKSK